MKSLHFKRSLGYIVTTIFCVIILCGCYFFIYLPANEKRVQEQRFRTLQNVDKNIHDKIENSVYLLNNLLTANKSYIDNYSKEKFTLSDFSRNAIDKKNRRNIQQDSLVRLVVIDSIGQVTIGMQKPSADSNYILKGSLKFTFKQFIEYLLPSDVFDEYVIFFKDKIVYETFPSGITITNADSLYKSSSGAGGACLKDIVSGGTEYKFFLHAVHFGGENKWFLGGMLANSRYFNERSQLPAGIILLMIILVLGMIVIFPWIKLYQMGSKDSLTLIDGASIILVSMILMSLLSLSLFKYNVFIRGADSPDSKKTLATQINDAFYNETKRVYNVLNYYDTLQLDNKTTTNIINLKTENIAFAADEGGNKKWQSSTLSQAFKDSLKNYKGAADIQQIYWLDNSGTEVHNWTVEAQNAPFANYSARNYYKSFKTDKIYYLDGDSTKKYYLDQVVSWTTGTFTSVMSMPTRDSKNYLAVATFNMKAVENTVLPAGYSFAIIDNSGKVLYHSNKSKNLNENVRSEFSNSAGITNSINSRLTGEFLTNYYSKSYSVFVTPIRYLPYSIIIFSDKTYKDTRDIEVYSFTFSMLLLLFLYIVLQLGITFIVSSRRSFFKKQLFDTSWIGPLKTRNNDYIVSAVFNLVVIATLMYFFADASFFQFLALVLFAIIFISLFFNALLARRYYTNKKKNNLRRKRYAIIALIVLLFIHNYVASCVLDSMFQLILIEIVAIVIGILFIMGKDRISATIIKALPVRWQYTHSFALMVVTTLLITSGIPIAFFYISSYNYEQKLGIRYRQSDFANGLLAQPHLNLYIPRDSSMVGKIITYDTTGLYYDKSYIMELPAVIHKSAIYKNESLTEEKKRSLQVLGAFRLLVSDNAIQTDKLCVSSAADSSLVYHPGFFDKHEDNGVYTYRQTGIRDYYLKLHSYKLNYKIPQFFVLRNFLSYWIWMLVILVVFYFVILNIIKKLFCLNMPDLKIWEELDNELLTNNNLNKFLFIIGLPGAGKTKTFIQKIKDGKVNCGGEVLIYDEVNTEDNNVLLADLINIPDTGAEIGTDKNWIRFTKKASDSKYKVVIFNHFEYNIQDEFTNLAKLNLLEQLMLQGNCKIIILSTIHPVNFLDSLNENINQSDASEKTGHDLERWHVLLGHYRISIMPITKQVENEDVLSNQLLCSETDYTHFLHDMQQVTLDIAKKNKEKDKLKDTELQTDELALKLQITAHYFYMYIWQSLTKEEKFLLYDLAEDNLVNSYDDFTLTMLLAKGVIINTEGSLHLFNRGFRNFILTAIGHSEKLKIKERIRQNGNWSNLRTPLIIVIAAILAFLLISQQEAYSKLLTYVAALSAGVPIVLKIFSLFDRSTSKTGS